MSRGGGGGGYGQPDQIGYQTSVSKKKKKKKKIICKPVIPQLIPIRLNSRVELCRTNEHPLFKETHLL